MGLIVLLGVLLLAAAFLVGSIPFGLVISKYIFKKDLREHGSGNIGATNAMRVLGKKAGIAVFLLDFVKGFVATLIGWLLGAALFGDAGSLSFAGSNAFMCLGLFGVVLGHCFSPWLNWKGGKGIAAAGGGLFVVLGPLGGIIELAAFGLVAVVTRYASLGSLTAAWLLLPFSAYKFLIAVPEGQSPAVIAFVLCVIAILLVTWAHRGNIKRLLNGTERRFGSKGKNKDPEADDGDSAAVPGDSLDVSDSEVIDSEALDESTAANAKD